MRREVEAAIERATRATLVFDLARIEANLRAVAAAARASDIRVLFAVKSFPHVAVRALAAELFDGEDVASQAEADGAVRGILSIADPSGRAHRGWPGRLVVSCETIAQVEAAPATAEIAIRVSASITGRDPAIGAILDGSGHRRSRFGVATRDEIAALRHAAGGRRVGLHVHHGAVIATSAERFAASAHALLEAADFAPAFLDLGGAWHGVPELAQAFATLRAQLGAVELIVEPGRVLSLGAGFATGRVGLARRAGERELRVVDLSRIAHLRWSAIELVAPPPAGGGAPVLFVGPTCFEEDALGEWIVAQPYTPGDRAVFSGATGYAVAWNTGFGGVPPADVVLV